MAAVDIKDVRKAFGATEVIHGVDIHIEDGEFVVLVGPSGCGKSTLLRMIAGLETVTAGEIRIGPRVVNDVPPKDRDIAMVFQNYALYPHMTVADNMGFSLKLRGAAKAEIDERVDRAAGILGLTQLLERYPRQLSGGQRQRVAMGRAIVRDPQVFLFDEPLSNLDAKLRVAMRAEIKELHQRLKTTTVYVTHDQIEAMTMADRIVVMHDGVVEQMGTPLELYDRPGNTFVAGFIGSPSMNFFKGKVAVNGKAAFVGDNGVTFPLASAPATYRRPPGRPRRAPRAHPDRPRGRAGRGGGGRAHRLGDAGGGEERRQRDDLPLPRAHLGAARRQDPDPARSVGDASLRRRDGSAAVRRRATARAHRPALSSRPSEPLRARAGTQSVASMHLCRLVLHPHLGMGPGSRRARRGPSGMTVVRSHPLVFAVPANPKYGSGAARIQEGPTREVRAFGASRRERSVNVQSQERCRPTLCRPGPPAHGVLWPARLTRSRVASRNRPRR